MRLLAALGVGVSVILGPTPLAHSDPGTTGGDEAAFLASLRGAGITYSTPDGAVKFAKAVCVSMANGELGPQMVDELKSQNPRTHRRPRDVVLGDCGEILLPAAA